MKVNYLIIGVLILLILLPLWYFAVVPEFEKMPKDYSFNGVLAGTERPNYVVGGNSTEFIAYNGIRNVKVIKVNGDILEIEAYFKAEELGGQPLFEISQDYAINRKTREIVSGYERAGYLIPPADLKKKDYIIQDMTLLVDNEYKFEREETIKGLRTYLFNGVINNLDTTEGYEFLDLVPEKYSVEDDIDEQMWIEPITGIVIDFRQDGKSYYIEDGNKIHQFTHYTNSFQSDTITAQILKAQNEKFKLMLLRIIIPFLFAVAMAIVILFLSFRREGKK
jgi:hypothetical protein